MKTVIQRVTSAKVEVDGLTVGQIGRGIVMLQSIAPTDTDQTVARLVGKLRRLAIFEGEQGRMGRTLEEVSGAILLVSQFTLHATLDKGRSPSFSRAARPEQARPLYELTRDRLGATGIPVQTGQFGATMEVTLTNDGPVTLLLDVDE